ncbi:hypothetical protein AB4581_08675 [Vibrio cyclitrophicus]
MPSWRLEPSAVKVARWVLRETALGNKCRPPDIFMIESAVSKNSDYEDFGQKSVRVDALNNPLFIT